MSGNQPLRVCLDARLTNEAYGGVLQFIIGLASGLSRLTDGEEEYHFLTYASENEWLQPYITGPCQILTGPEVPRPRGWKVWLKTKIPQVTEAWHKLSPLAGRLTIDLPKSDGTIEKAGIQVMHFTKQGGFLTEVPSIYHPHDLQHLHLPKFFNNRTRMYKEITYKAFCDQARMVAVESSWTKQDLMRHYRIPEDKIWVIPLAPILEAYPTPNRDDLAATRQKFSLPEAFFFYPAQTWEHKNHLGLLEALFLLRQHHGLKVHFVFTGSKTDFYPQIEKRAQELQIFDQIQFLGFVSPLDLQCLYKLCRGVIIPSKFEAASFPLYEAFLAEAPAACSNVTSLPEQAGNAALIFDPDKPEEIAEVIRRLWTDETLRHSLAALGSHRVASFTWDRTVRTFRAHYRRIAGRPLMREDREILAAPPWL